MEVQVQVPSHSLNFTVNIPPSANVRNLKEAINGACSGNPSVGGQRLITKGRLLRDEELLDSLWANPGESKVVFLAVHPSAWSSTPPPVPAAEREYSQPLPPPPPPPYLQDTLPSTSTSATNLRTTVASRGRTMAMTTAYPSLSMLDPPSAIQPLAYIQNLHTHALRILIAGSSPVPPVQGQEPRQVPDRTRSKEWAKLVVESYGVEWPTVLDDDFLSTPVSDGEDQGIKYRAEYIDGYPYISLLPTSSEPTSLQLRALEILRYTFPLLPYKYHPITDSILPTGQPAPVVPHTHLHHVATTIPPPQNQAQAQAQAQQARRRRRDRPAFPLRAIIAPLLMLCLRTVFLLYIFSPSRKPLVAAIVILWMVWEVWGAAREVINAEVREMERARAARPGAAAGAGGGAPPPPPEIAAIFNNPAANFNANGVPPRAGERQNNGWGIFGIGALFNTPESMLNKLAEWNLATEHAALFPPPHMQNRDEEEPSVIKKLTMALGLFVLSIHPGIWGRRKAKLRVREGEVKKERAEVRRRREGEEGGQAVAAEGGGENSAAAGEETQTGTAQREEQPPLPQRAAWLEAYMDRVERAEWVDG